jgi:hypothetical protein
MRTPMIADAALELVDARFRQSLSSMLLAMWAEQEGLSCWDRP